MPDRYIRFGAAYRRFRQLQVDALCSCAIEDVPENPLAQMLLAATLLHERAGTNPAFQRYHREAILEVLAEARISFESRVCDDESFPDRVWRSFELRCPGGRTNKNITYGVVADSLRVLRQHGTDSWIRLFRSKSPADAWTIVDRIGGVGPKLASLMLREFHAFFKIWPEVPLGDWYCVFPLDRWVLRVAKLLWPTANWPIEPPPGASSYRTLTKDITSRFGNVDDAMNFNMGAWFLSAMRLQVLALHGEIVIGDLSDPVLHECAMSLNADRVAAALAIGPKAGAAPAA